MGRADELGLRDTQPAATRPSATHGFAASPGHRVGQPRGYEPLKRPCGGPDGHSPGTRERKSLEVYQYLY
jgi:hypothetical protein